MSSDGAAALGLARDENLALGAGFTGFVSTSLASSAGGLVSALLGPLNRLLPALAKNYILRIQNMPYREKYFL